MNTKEVLLLAANFLLLVLLFPFVQLIFKQLGVVLLSEAAFIAHPWLNTVFSHGIILFLLFFYLKATLESLHTWGFVFKKDWLTTSVIIGIVAGITLYLIDISQGLFSVYEVPADPSVLAVVGFLFAWAFLGPLTEEVLFRSIIQTTLMKRVGGFWLPILVTVGLEVLMHSGVLLSGFVGWPMLAYVFVFSLSASWIYQKTRSLLGPFLIHALGNGLELLLFWII